MTKLICCKVTKDKCWEVISHKLNHDGYFRKYVKGVLVMYYRVVYEDYFGEIPEGHEVDHMCRNRACINPRHLQTLSRTDHLVKTNKERYAPRKAAAKVHWETTGCTGTELAKVFNITFGTTCGWIREWKKTICHS